RLEPDGWSHSWRSRGRIAVPPHPVVKAGAALRARPLAHGGELLRRGVAAVGLALGKQLLGDLAMAVGAAELVDDVAIPVQLQPFQPVQDRRYCGLRGALAVG